MYWEKQSVKTLSKTVFKALGENLNYNNNNALGFPGSNLDPKEFDPQAPFLKNAPYLSTLISNPNHIGCHTIDNHFPGNQCRGTQKIEKEIIELLACKVFKAEPDSFDGYIASGGTEGNIEAMWIYRNYFKNREAANVNEIAVIYSEDAHYSMPKGADLLGLSSIVVPVDQSTREISYELLNEKLDEHISKGFKYFIVILSMGTTMFGSVDNIDKVCHVFNGKEVEYKVHIDAAFGGFIYPFSNSKSNICFLHPHVSSIVVDGHKMLQAPYGTGMFLIRKGYIHYVCTMEAQYLPGKDFTLCGSRSGANAVATWMILNMWGSAGWKAKIAELIKRTDRLCKELSQIDIPYYRNKFMNIVALRSVGVGRKIAEKYNLVANTYDKKEDWWKLVVMPHVDDKVLSEFVIDIKNQHKNY